MVSPNISLEDEVLNQRLIGSWKAKNYETLTFNPDGTFIDTLWADIPYTSTVYAPVYVIEGNYSVKNGLLNFYDATFTYVRAAADKFALQYYSILYPRYVRMDSDDMFLQVTPVLSSRNDSTLLNGEWEMTNWICVYNKNYDPQIVGGKIKESYNFVSSELKCNYNRTYFFDAGVENISIISAYTYEHPRINFQTPDLDFGSFFGVMIAHHTENEMRWVASDAVYYTRIK